MAARPRKGAGGKGPEKEIPPGDRPTVINLKGSAEYVAWLDEVARKTHFPKATIFRLAVAEWAERQGLPAPPEF